MGDWSDCLVNVTVTSFNRLAATKRCLKSLCQSAGVPMRLTVVDNGSSDGSPEYLQTLLEAGSIDNLLLCHRNAGVSVAANLGWASVDTPYYVKLDNDVEILREGWLSTLVELSEQTPDVGTMGYYIEEHRAESASGAPYFAVPHSVGSCVLISRAVHERLGFWNEDYGLYGMEDSDFSTRVNAAGLKNYYVAHSERVIRHSHGLYRNDAHLDDEIRKTHGVSDEFTAMFYFNNALFLSGVRSAYVGRKYKARLRPDHQYDFFPDPAYLEAEKRYSTERRAFIDDYIRAVASEAQG